ncbi:ABC transporter ATP-binding protein [Anaerovorax odorimutans]|uniref:ABC transporter ATP-binding protein n=1 Tax=Anaerovorax odorimutans TaxID=109327 RepID=UPI000427E4F3|nr:ABC transporter ATP-binding protein [Anaerovorax odorimutans]
MNEIPILEIKNLKTYFYQKEETIKAVDDISMKAFSGKITAIVGESGSGKSVTTLSILRLIQGNGKIIGGEILLKGEDMLKMTEKQLCSIRGKDISMIFQDPSGALNPVIKIKKQLIEAIKLHNKQISKKECIEKCIKMIKAVGLREPEKIMESYPFELSGGMCQRAMVAMALLSTPKVLIADEPTTSLDLTIQAVILDEIYKLKGKNMAIILITHDLSVVAQMADDVYIMHNGHIVESGTVFDVFDVPKHEYTKSLLRSIS